MIVISMQNEGGELDRRTAKTEEAARTALLEMIESLPHVQHGDRFIVTETTER